MLSNSKIPAVSLPLRDVALLRMVPEASRFTDAFLFTARLVDSGDGRHPPVTPFFFFFLTLLSNQTAPVWRRDINAVKEAREYI